MEENKKPRSGRVKFYILLALVSIAAVGVEFFFFKLPEAKAIQDLAIVLLGQVVVVFAYEAGLVYSSMFSGDSPGRPKITWTITVMPRDLRFR